MVGIDIATRWPWMGPSVRSRSVFSALIGRAASQPCRRMMGVGRILCRTRRRACLLTHSASACCGGWAIAGITRGGGLDSR